MQICKGPKEGCTYYIEINHLCIHSVFLFRRYSKWMILTFNKQRQMKDYLCSQRQTATLERVINRDISGLSVCVLTKFSLVFLFTNLNVNCSITQDKTCKWDQIWVLYMRRRWIIVITVHYSLSHLNPCHRMVENSWKICYEPKQAYLLKLVFLLWGYMCQKNIISNVNGIVLFKFYCFHNTETIINHRSTPLYKHNHRDHVYLRNMA